jgi:hypothetical protein
MKRLANTSLIVSSQKSSVVLFEDRKRFSVNARDEDISIERQRS